MFNQKSSTYRKVPVVEGIDIESLRSSNRDVPERQRAIRAPMQICAGPVQPDMVLEKHNVGQNRLSMPKKVTSRQCVSL